MERETLLEARVERLEQLPGQVDALRRETNARFDTVDARFDTVDRRLTTLQVAVFTRLDQTNNRISVLHEDLLARLASIAEERPHRRKRR